MVENAKTLGPPTIVITMEKAMLGPAPPWCLICTVDDAEQREGEHDAERSKVTMRNRDQAGVVLIETRLLCSYRSPGASAARSSKRWRRRESMIASETCGDRQGHQLGGEHSRSGERSSPPAEDGILRPIRHNSVRGGQRTMYRWFIGHAPRKDRKSPEKMDTLNRHAKQERAPPAGTR